MGMTLEKAIEILPDFLEPCAYPRNSDQIDALMLGVEALKRLEAMRVSPCTTADEILPGETTD